jgi:hypothetical protein
MGQDLRDGVRLKPRKLIGIQKLGVGALRGRFFAGRGTPSSQLVSEVEERFGEGAELRGERVDSDNVPVLLPSLPDPAVWGVAEAVSASGGGPELVDVLCMLFTGLCSHRLTCRFRFDATLKRRLQILQT